MKSGSPSSLKQLRKASGKSTELVAVELGLTERHVRRLEAGDTPMKRLHAIGLAHVYGVPVADVEKAAA